jgi:uncharacterized membrane protein YcfT
MTWLAIIWAIFAGIFLVLGIFQWKMKNRSISHLLLSRRQMPEGVTVTAEIAGVDFTEFTDKFNRYLDYYNQAVMKQHKIQAIGYWIASGTAWFSLAIALIVQSP